MFLPHRGLCLLLAPWPGLKLQCCWPEACNHLPTSHEQQPFTCLSHGLQIGPAEADYSLRQSTTNGLVTKGRACALRHEAAGTGVSCVLRLLGSCSCTNSCKLLLPPRSDRSHRTTFSASGRLAGAAIALLICAPCSLLLHAISDIIIVAVQANSSEEADPSRPFMLEYNT